MFSALISIDESAQDIEQLFNADNFDAKQSKVLFTKDEKKAKISIESKDIVSFRASLNAITTMLNIYYQSKKIVTED